MSVSMLNIASLAVGVLSIFSAVNPFIAILGCPFLTGPVFGIALGAFSARKSGLVTNVLAIATWFIHILVLELFFFPGTFRHVFTFDIGYL